MTGRARRTASAMLLGGLVTVPTLVSGAPTRAAPAAATAPGAQAPPEVLDEPPTGRDAVAALGSDLATTAARHATTPSRLRTRLERDPTLWVDETLQLFQVEPVGGLEEVGPEEGLGADRPASAPADVFALHSLPGADRVVYLDFDGHTTTGTGWNNDPVFGTGPSFVSAPYDSDGDPGSFSAAEQDVIFDVWQRVTEDFAPFAVDVTTADPGAAAIDRSGDLDQQFGTRVVVTWTNPVGQWCGCGGVAYVGVFGLPTDHAFYQPAFAFQAYLGGAGATGKTLAEAASHEAGHNLGLFHDGTSSGSYYLGHGAWAPIMGAGYYRPISQWSKGEYANANNPEDDLARMGLFGAPLLADDHGDTPATATAIGSTATGRIVSAADVDAFSFTLPDARFTTVAASPAPTGANLDIHLSLLGADGRLLLEGDPPSATVSAGVASGLGASVSATLPAGTYVAVVDGVGAGATSGSGYSDYGSLGTYDVTVTQTPATCVAPPTGIIGWWTGEDSLAAEVGPALTGGAGFGLSIVGRGLVPDGLDGLTAVGFPTISDEVTVEAWIRPEGTGFVQSLFSRFRWLGTEADSSFALFLTDQHLLWIAEEPSLRERPSVSAAATVLYDGAFHHVAATWGDEMVLYIDGVAVARAPARGAISPAPATDLVVGGTSTGPGHALAYSGLIDEPTVYSRALSGTEIEAIHTAGAGGKCRS